MLFWVTIKLQTIWHKIKINVIGLSLYFQHDENICFWNDLGCYTWNIFWADSIGVYTRVSFNSSFLLLFCWLRIQVELLKNMMQLVKAL